MKKRASAATRSSKPVALRSTSLHGLAGIISCLIAHEKIAEAEAKT
jgi:hypothetical protein